MKLNQFSVRVIGGRETSSGYVEIRHNQKYSLSLRNSRSRRCDAQVEIDGKHIGTWRIPAHSNIVLERPADDDGCFTFYRAGSKKGAKAGIVEGDPKNGLVVVTFTPEKRTIPPVVIHHYEWPRYPWVWPRRPWPYEPHYPYIPYRPWITWITAGDSTADASWKSLVTYGSTAYSSSAGDSSIGSVSCSAAIEDTTGVRLSPEEAADRAVERLKPVIRQLAEYDAGGTGLSGQSDQEYGVAGSIYHDHSQETVISLRLVGVKKRRGEPRPLLARGNPVPPPVV